MIINKHSEVTPYKVAKEKIKAKNADLQATFASLDPFNRSIIGKIFNEISAIFSAIDFGITRNGIGKCLNLLGFRPEYCNASEISSWNKWKENSKGLVLMLHGLRGHPAQFDGHLRALRKFKDLDLRAPFIVKKGDCPKEEMLEPLKEILKNYIDVQRRKNSGNISVCLLGISNGGRLSIILTEWMAKNYPEVKLLTLANAPVLHGTKITESFPFKISKFHPAIQKDFVYKDRDRKWVKKAVGNLPKGFKLRSYIGTQDSLVFPYPAGMLPVNTGANVKNYIFRMSGHTGILQDAQDLHLNEMRDHFSLI